MENKSAEDGRPTPTAFKATTELPDLAEIFARSSATKRTPPKRGSKTPEPKAQATPVPDAKEKKSVVQMLAEMKESIDALQAFADSKNNLHHEVKKMIRAVKMAMIEVLREMEDKKVVQKSEAKSLEAATSKATPKVSFIDALGSKNGQEGSAKKKRKKPDEDREGRSPQKKRQKEKKEGGDQTPKGRPLKSLSKKESDEDGYEKVERKKRPQAAGRSRAPKRARPEAVIIEVGDGSSYADVLRRVRGDPNLKEVAENVLRVKRTQKGQLLLEMKRSEGKKNYQELVERALGSRAVAVRSIIHETSIVCKDIDEITTKEEVLKAIEEQFQIGTPAETAIKSLRPTYGGTQMAIISLPSDQARKLLSAGKVRIGWTVCRLREFVSPKTCYRCLGYGHIAKDCKNTDRSKLCRRCGEEGHVAKACEKKPKCLLCTGDNEAKDHITGGSKCPKFTQALKKARG